ncbi:hypothetical protein GIB67_008563 [Kingdonia uniflora]|uniref:Alcohol dehydrogenase-like C-terminal domain-containing protein n=1 Tax=Kingdonia uniflora TaxID=39325 RepID=A0A7J7N443_9MAGN|nr:hypothetical protein GIB67_008563 [Kingdonia uniflora]
MIERCFCLVGRYRFKTMVRKQRGRIYLDNIIVVRYDFKEERFVQLHRSAIGFPGTRFFYSGTPTSSTSNELALKGEALVRTQFQEDPYGCLVFKVIMGSINENCLGWATRDTSGVLSPYNLIRRYVFKIPDNCPFILAAPLLCAGIIVYAFMMCYKMNKPGKSLGVVGFGGLGPLAVKFGKAFGLHVKVFSTSNSKKDEAMNLLGADKFIISSNMQQMEPTILQFLSTNVLSLFIWQYLNNFLDRSSRDTLSESDVQSHRLKTSLGFGFLVLQKSSFSQTGLKIVT